MNFTFFLFDLKKHRFNKAYILAISIFFSVISPSYPSLRVEIIIPNPSSIDKPSLYLLSKF